MYHENDFPSIWVKGKGEFSPCEQAFTVECLSAPKSLRSPVGMRSREMRVQGIKQEHEDQCRKGQREQRDLRAFLLNYLVPQLEVPPHLLDN